jgi:predicted O-methyltransferase YrrM
MSTATASSTAMLPSVLVEIFERNAVRDGDNWIELHSHMSVADGQYLQKLLRSANATRSLEVGMAYGVSTLFICDELKRVSPSSVHVVIDPFQRSDWKGIGLANVARAGFSPLTEFFEEPSEFVLPRLAASGRELDFALVDGWHSFDQALVEFFYIDRMLRVGGIVAFDDADWPGISKLMRFLVTLPAYEPFAAQFQSRRPSLLGRLRRQLSDTKLGRTALHPSLRRRAWDLGIFGRCIALRKVAPNKRDMKWFEDF